MKSLFISFLYLLVIVCAFLYQSTQNVYSEIAFWILLFVISSIRLYMLVQRKK